MKKRAQFSVEQREKILEDLEKSDLSITEFARQHQMSRVLLSVWLSRYRARNDQASSCLPTKPTMEVATTPRVSFQELSLGHILGQPAWAAEIVLPGGMTVRLDQQGRTELLHHLRQTQLC